jgi:hypothetical protein
MVDQGRRGSALVIALIVAAVLAALGISFLMLAETEGRIARNEERVDQARRAAEAAAGIVRAWFDRPWAADHLILPPDAAIDRTLRTIDDDGDPATPPWPQDGSAWPRYKQGIDLDGDGRDDLFRPPYRGALVHALHGTETGPDLRIDSTASAAAASFLSDLSDRLFAGFPRPSQGVHARILCIDVYGPPHVRSGGAWVRFGLGRVKVVAAIMRRVGGTDRVVARRAVRVVLHQVPYGRSAGPLQSCAGLEWTGPLTASWGRVDVTGDATLAPIHAARPSSWPRVIPPAGGVDLLWGYDDPAAFGAYRGRLETAGERLEDPWLRLIVGGTIAGAPPAPQPFPFVWDPTVPDPLGDGTRTHHDHAVDDGNHANLFHRLPPAPCAPLDYTLWKTIATSGGRDVRYFAWAGGTRFREDGIGPAREFRDLTDGREGLLFFDTADGTAPADVDGDGLWDNLTPAIHITGGTWGVRGLLILNAASFRVDAAGRPAQVRAPGEPFQDGDADGRHDPGETWVNLAYPTIHGGPFVVDGGDVRRDDGTRLGPPVRNRRGPAAPVSVALWGMLWTHGRFESRGNATYYGRVVAGSGVVDPGSPVTTPTILWDADLAGDWPPPGWSLPRVVFGAWEP